MYRRLIILASVFGIGIFIVNALANTFYWYASMERFDMFMHTMGGIFIAILGGAILVRKLDGLKRHEIFIALGLFVFIIGLGWEYYEYIVQFYIKNVHLADIADSISDLICDMLGGIIGTYFVILLKKRYNKA